MKKKRISSTSSLLPIIMAAAVILTLGCQKEEEIFIPGINNSSPVEPGDNMKITFVVQPTGTTVTAFDGAVELNFPSGAVYFPTEFTLVSCCMDNMDSNGINIMNQGFYLELEDDAADLVLHEHIEVHLKYDLGEDSWNTNIPDDDENLTIYNAYPNLDACQKVKSIGDCCTDGDFKMVMGCIEQCGYYVVGEN